jgi:saccharopine dehydrogenase (NAD+, L-lysine-forming)
MSQTQPVGIRAEDMYAWERRAPLVPVDLASLARETQIRCCVQSSRKRAFSDDEYRSAGIDVVMSLQDCPIIVGLKEIPPEVLEKGKTYAIFAHVTKGQAFNMPMLQRLLDLEATLIDYERIVDEEGRRLVFFGNYAGLAGAIDTLWALGRRLEWEGLSTPLNGIRQASEYGDLNEAKEAVARVGEQIASDGLPDAISPLIIGIAGYGNVSRGAQEILDLLSPVEIRPAALLSGLPLAGLSQSRPIAKIVFQESDTVVRREGSGFDLQEFYSHPERYSSQFDSFLSKLHVLVNCTYWEPRYPRLVTADAIEELDASGQLTLRVIGDIACDVEGAIEITVKATEPDDPVYVYEPGTRSIHSGVEGNGPVILAVDILPSELPREASTYFSGILKSFIPQIATADYGVEFSALSLPSELKRALICHRGELAPDYRYLERYVGSGVNLATESPPDLPLDSPADAAIESIADVGKHARASVTVERPAEPPYDVDDSSQEPRRPEEAVPRLQSDCTNGDDCLGIEDEVRGLGSVLLLRNLSPPLCVGVFGRWGAGKTFFMERMQLWVERRSRQSLEAEERGEPSVFCARTVQIRFNAWHYVDAHLPVSLHNSIIEALDTYLRGTEAGKQMGSALGPELETAKQKRAEAKLALESAERTRSTAEQKLREVEQEKALAHLDLKRIYTDAARSALCRNPEAAQQLRDATESLGLRTVGQSIEEIIGSSQSLRSTWSRAKAAVVALAKGPHRVLRLTLFALTLVIILCTGPAITWFLRQVMSTSHWEQLVSVLGRLAVWGSLVATWFAKLARWSSALTDHAEQARSDVETILRAAEAEAGSDAKTLSLRAELSVLREQEVSARRLLEEAERELREAENRKAEVETQTTGQLLREFLAERLQGGVFSAHLGIVDTIRRDLEALSSRYVSPTERVLDDVGSGSEIDRVVLYIDDLDRCPEATVVEVLQAVHLLLAFPLFVVVIGVDARWLLHSLQSCYAPLKPQRPTNGTDSGETQRLSQDYLEKIIQIPFQLREIESAGFRRLIQGSLPSSLGSPQGKSKARQAASGPSAEEDGTTAKARPQSTAGGRPRSSERPERSELSGDTPLEPVVLQITEKEVLFLSEMCCLIHTPRSAKLLANIYRLVRASIPTPELHGFLKEDDEEATYKSVILLVGIQVAFPTVAMQLHRTLHEMPSLVWSQLAARLDQDCLDTGVRKLADHVLVAQQRMTASLITDMLNRKALPSVLRNADVWIRRISRYSFRAVSD